MNGRSPTRSARPEEIGARAGHPFAGFRGRRSGRHVPGGSKRAKVIQPNHVHMGQQGADPFDPPGIAGARMGLPVVNRVAPELSLRAEVIRRNARHETRPAPFVQQEQFRVGPDVAGVGRNKEGQIADQPHTPCAGILFQTSGLPEQQELRQANLIDLIRQDSPRLARGQRVPVAPIRAGQSR